MGQHYRQLFLATPSPRGVGPPFLRCVNVGQLHCDPAPFPGCLFRLEMNYRRGRSIVSVFWGVPLSNRLIREA